MDFWQKFRLIRLSVVALLLTRIPIICLLCVLCVSVVRFLIPQMIAIRGSTTEAQRARRGKGRCKGPVWFGAFWLRLCRAGFIRVHPWFNCFGCGFAAL